MSFLGVFKKVFRKRKLILREKEVMYGRFFIFLWFIGFVYFFIILFIIVVYYIFIKIKIGDSGFEFIFVGFENYFYVFIKDLNYI